MLRSRVVLSATKHIPVVSKLAFHGRPGGAGAPAKPLFRVLDGCGRVAGGRSEVEVEDECAVRVMQTMVKLRLMDQVLHNAQRQGRISFYLTSEGEEGAVVGSAAGLSPEDEVFSQYREQGVLMYRGFQYDDFMEQCFSTSNEPARGRQMPVHYGSRDLHFQTVSSTIATQIPNAVGAAYSLKRRKEKRISATFFGDGGTSEGDFHAGLNFAASIQCPVLFICRNNGWAISTPAEQQFRGQSLSQRGAAYGVPSATIDGNDPLAVICAVRKAREKCLSSQGPVFLELRTYRRGSHSTSDDHTKYRTTKTVEETTQSDPIVRLRTYLTDRGLWREEEERKMVAEEKSQITEAMKRAEEGPKPPPEDLFNDVHDQLSRIQQLQCSSLLEHVGSHKPQYT
mmetsp:Transcript_9613/g.29109  ORF Transcript_9613/g.29109 Transcript_9613/m.29109 type:complete len:397 (-) Transcript_9613:3765-4955(-)